MVSGESHWYLGRRYRLRVVEAPGRPSITIVNHSTMELRCLPGTTAERRSASLERWYRRRLREIVPPMLETWAPVLGVEVSDWRIRKMKTKWGSCRATERRIWMNVELAKKPRRCLEYIVVHELAHLIERRHNGRFQSLLDRSLPRWQLLRAELGTLPLAHDIWPD
jgi:hypothetical protein